MIDPRRTGPSDRQLRAVLTRAPQAEHLAEQLDLVAVSVRRTRQVRLPTTRWLVLAAAVALLLVLVVLGLVGSNRPPRPTSGLLAAGSGWDIALVRGDGSDLRWLTRDANTEWSPTWSPDGARLAYWLNDPLPPGDTCGVCGIPTAPRLVVANPFVVPMQPTALTRLSHDAGWRLSWSPNNRQIAVGDIENGVRILAVIDVESGNRTRLGPATLDGWDPAWSPDGRRIAFAHGRDDPSKRALDLIDVDGTNLRQLSTVPSRGAGFDTPVWSPLGDRIAFATETAGVDPFQRDIWTVRLDGLPEVDLSNDVADEFGANWSPDGSRLAWLRQASPGSPQFHVVIADATGARATVLPQAVGNTPPIWSPDGSRVLAVQLRGTSGSDRLVAIDVLSGAEVTVMDQVPDDAASWQAAQR